MTPLDPKTMAEVSRAWLDAAGGWHRGMWFVLPDGRRGVVISEPTEHGISTSAGYFVTAAWKTYGATLAFDEPATVGVAFDVVRRRIDPIGHLAPVWHHSGPTLQWTFMDRDGHACGSGATEAAALVAALQTGEKLEK